MSDDKITPILDQKAEDALVASITSIVNDYAARYVTGENINMIRNIVERNPDVAATMIRNMITRGTQNLVRKSLSLAAKANQPE